MNASGSPSDIRHARASDLPAMTALYNHYIRESIATFEEDELRPAQFGERLEAVRAAQLPWLIAEHAGDCLGYAYAAPWRTRSAYRFTVETSIYLDPGQRRRGLGTQLYGALLAILRQGEIHSAIGGITLPNAASVALHEKLGFLPVAHFAEVGYKFDRWLDVGYWQVPLQAADE